VTHIDLKKLPEAHPLRTTPLADINAELRNNAAPSEEWRRVEMHWDIARQTFNALPLSWKTYADWRVAKPTQ
jgi:hypothetical protein